MAPAKFKHPTGDMINRSEKFSWACPLRHTGLPGIEWHGGPGCAPEPPYPPPNPLGANATCLVHQLSELLAGIRTCGSSPWRGEC